MKTIQKHENQKSKKHRQRWLSPNNRISSGSNVCPRNISIASLRKRDHCNQIKNLTIVQVKTRRLGTPPTNFWTERRVKEKKLPSEIKAVLCYTLLTLLTLFKMLTLFTLFAMFTLFSLLILPYTA